MRRHNIFTLGIILSCIYGINAMADWPTIPAENIWTNPERTTLANQRCSDCCKTDCWLPNGTYYDTKGTFTETCTGEPSEPTCGSSNGTYAVVNGQCKLLCDNGYYVSSDSCVYCDPASFGSNTQTESITGGSRSRSGACTSVNTSGGTSCSCSAYNYGGWSYSCASGAHQSGEQCVCDSGYYLSGGSCKYCDKSTFNVARVESKVEGCTTYSRDKNCTGVNVGTSSCSCSGYSYGDWYATDPGCNIGGRCVSLLESGKSHTSSGDTWSVTFSYGTLSGTSKCVGPSGLWACYCSLTSPVTSGWWMGYSVSNTCLSDCSEKCASYIHWLDYDRQKMCDAL
ncbi:MAG: hypothetical protein KBS86_01850 [Proteobacteria bacterium]|nr:hypothetical protein [Candidatus Enterousia scatequi]